MAPIDSPRLPVIEKETDDQVVLVFDVAGTNHDSRHLIIRRMIVGLELIVERVSRDGKIGLGVFWHEKMLGWVPDDIASVLKPQNFVRNRVAKLGTGPDGRWTELIVQSLLGGTLSATIKDEGVIVAGVHLQMQPKNIVMARQIAGLSRKERRPAIEEWNAMHLGGHSIHRRKGSKGSTPSS